MKASDLKIRLGLESYKNCYIQELLITSIPIYVVTINSLYPDKFISTKLMRFNEISDLFKVKNETIKVAKWSDPTNIDSYSFEISDNALVFVRDLCGLLLKEKRTYNFSKQITKGSDLK